MESPFPGMDPFLEDADHWRGFHNLLAAEILRRLNPLLVPKYYADIEVHEALEDVVIGRTHHSYPDVAVLERQPEMVQQQRAMAGTATVAAPLTRAIEIPEQFKLRAVRVYETATNLLVTTIEILSPANKNSCVVRRNSKEREFYKTRPVSYLPPPEFTLAQAGARINAGRYPSSPSVDSRLHGKDSFGTLRFYLPFIH